MVRRPRVGQPMQCSDAGQRSRIPACQVSRVHVLPLYPRLVSRLLQRPASMPAPAPFVLARHHHTHDPKPKDTHQRLHPAMPMPVPVRSDPRVAMSASHRRRWLVSRQSWVVSRGPWRPHTHGQTGPRTAKMYPLSKTVVLGVGGTG